MCPWRRNAGGQSGNWPSSRRKVGPLKPVTITGRAIAKSFWGKSWCANLERYSDYRNRLPRGRTYVRNGSILDLHIARGEIAAMVAGSSLYKVKSTLPSVASSHVGKSICRDLRW